VASLPHLSDQTFVTDGGMETVLIFRQGIDLPCFAAFPLLEHDRGVDALRAYFEPFVAIARENGVGIVLDAPTWRANADWGAQLGYDAAALDGANRRGVALVEEIAAGADGVDVVVSGAVGPRGDGYVPGELMTSAQAERYHRPQIETFADTAADVVTALTLTYADEAVGIASAAHAAGLPSSISFTVEVDGRLPSGQSLREAVEQVDRETDGAPAYYMVNCAYPTHIAHALVDGGEWRERVRGVRANASNKSHAELDESDQLDDGDPVELAADVATLRPLLPNLNVVGGCCGTDERHIAQLCATWLAENWAAPSNPADTHRAKGGRRDPRETTREAR
jgi:S-methylmethionine-dependent homocysteine/selenocysteine methylase